MKKFLSLVLSLVMAMSLVTVSAGAKDDTKGFTDASDIEYKEAVDVMSGIGIISGYRDDSFRPDGALTRGAAAKIIAYLNLGTKTADVLSCTTAPYKDVNPADTFAPYIAYVKNAKICDGYSDGTFRSGAPLTGFAFNKMLLTSLGYDSKAEGFTGANWSVAVAKLAVKIGLTDGNDDFTGLDTCTREEACLYALNTLQATEVEYDNKGTSININGAEIVTGASAAEKVITTNKDGKNIDDEKNGNNEYYLEFAEDHFDDLELKNATDDFGAKSNKWMYKDKEIGTYAKDADFEFTTTADGDTIKEKLEDMDLDEYKMADSAVWYENGDSHSHNFANSDKDLKDLTNSGEAGKQLVDLLGKGRLVKVYTEDQTIENVVVIDTYLAEITSISSASDKVTLEAKKDGVNIAKVDDDNDFYAQLSDMDEDDLVLVTLADKEVKSVAIPETEKGKISRISTTNKGADCDGLTFDGTKYKLSKQATDFSTDLEIKADDDSTLYLDTYGYAIWIDDVNENNDYVTAIDSYKSLVDGKLITVIQGYDMKGNEVSLNVGTKNYEDSALQGTVYKYESDDKYDGDYVLTADNTSTDKDNIITINEIGENVLKSNSVGIDSKYFDSDVIFLFIENGDDMDDVNVETKCQNVDKDTKVQYVLDEGKIIAVVISAESDTATGDDVAYVSEVTGSTKVDDKDATEYTLYIEGDEVEGVVSKDKDMKEDSFVTYAKNDDGTYKLKKYTDNNDKTSVVVDAKVKSVVKANKDIMTLDATTEDTTKGGSYTELKDLNCADAVIVDLTDEEDIGNMDDMYDAVMGDGAGTVKVSIVFNNKADDDDKGEVSYIFVTENSSDASTPDPDIDVDEDYAPSCSISGVTISVKAKDGTTDGQLTDIAKAYLLDKGYTNIKVTANKAITATAKDGTSADYTVEHIKAYEVKVASDVEGVTFSATKDGKYTENLFVAFGDTFFAKANGKVIESTKATVKTAPKTLSATNANVYEFTMPNVIVDDVKTVQVYSVGAATIKVTNENAAEYQVADFSVTQDATVGVENDVVSYTVKYIGESNDVNDTFDFEVTATGTDTFGSHAQVTTGAAGADMKTNGVKSTLTIKSSNVSDVQITITATKVAD